MGIFKQLGALVGKKTPKSMPKAPKVPENPLGALKIEAPIDRNKSDLDFGEKVRQKMYSPFIKDMEKIVQEQTKAFEEIEKNIPAPVIRIVFTNDETMNKYNSVKILVLEVEDL